LSAQPDIPYLARPIRRDPVQASLSGFRSPGVSIYKVWTQSALSSKSKGAIDVIVIRFVLTGALSDPSAAIRQECTKGYALLTPHEQISEFFCAADTEFLTLAIDRMRLEEVSKLFSYPDDYRWDRFASVVPAEASNIANCQRLAQFMMLQLAGGLHDAGSIYPMLEESLLVQILAVWPRNTQPQRNIQIISSRGVRRALAFIDENLQKPITAGDVAKACGMCIRSLQTSFKREFGYTPSNYILFARLDMVRAEICNLEQPPYVSEVAYKWGFRHMGDFSARYKARFGLTPKQDRERALADRKKVYKLIN
jgi:AraC-like DNA-binding protein